MRTKTVKGLWYFIFILVTLAMLYPLFFAISNSFKTVQDAFNTITELIPRNPTLINYIEVFQRLDLATITGNTLVMSITVTVFKLMTSILAAYAFVFFDFKFKNAIYFMMVSTIFIPFTVTMIPNFITITRLGFIDNIFGVVLPQLADALGIFLIRQNMKMIPKSLIEYAHVEKLGHWRIMKDIVVPLAKPGIISTGIIFFINSWNEYVWPMLILRTRENYTMALALQSFISAEGGSNFTFAMALSVVSMLVPLILFLIFQKHIISTFISSGVKG